MTYSSGILTLKVRQNGAETWGILRSLRYGEATNEMPRKEAMATLEKARSSWQANYWRFHDADFQIVDSNEVPLVRGVLVGFDAWGRKARPANDVYSIDNRQRDQWSIGGEATV